MTPDITPPARIYLLTWRTYGTWLHGDARGSADRRGHGRVLLRESAPLLAAWEMGRLRGAIVPRLSDEDRVGTARSIAETCAYRGWRLYAVNVPLDHVHVVVGTSAEASRVLHDLKAYATRALRATGRWPPRRPVWTSTGHVLPVTSDRALEAAIRYVIEGQGEPLEGAVSAGGMPEMERGAAPAPSLAPYRGAAGAGP